MPVSVIRLLAAAPARRLLGAVALTGGLCGVWPAAAGAQFALRSKIEGTLTDSTGAVPPAPA